MRGYTATAETEINATEDRVWAALTDPALIKRYMFGSVVDTTWQPGDPITWSGVYEGKPYQDKGEVVTFAPPHRLVVTHYSPMSGQPDEPENYHTVDYVVAETEHGSTKVTLTQDGNGSEDEAEHSTANWSSVLEGLKKVAE